MQSTANIN